MAGHANPAVDAPPGRESMAGCRPQGECFEGKRGVAAKPRKQEDRTVARPVPIIWYACARLTADAACCRNDLLAHGSHDEIRAGTENTEYQRYQNLHFHIASSWLAGGNMHATALRC